MPDAPAPAPAPAAAPAPAPSAAATPSAPSTPAGVAAAEADQIGRFVAAHNAALAAESTHADAPRQTNRSATARPAGNADARPAETDSSDSNSETRPGGAEADADGPGAPDDAAAPALSEADAVALFRSARAAGDVDGINRALAALDPELKAGLDEFKVDGRRYAEFRQATKKQREKDAARDAELSTRERNLQAGQQQIDAIVQRLTPIESLVNAAQDESAEGVTAFVALVEKATRKPFNETAKRYLDIKLQKPGDPEVEALRRELRETKQQTAEREQKEREQKELAAQAEQIRGHLVYLNETLTKDPDPRVQRLVSTDDGIRAIFNMQRQHYNPQTRTTLSAGDAARKVLERLEPLRKVLVGDAPRAAPAVPAPATPPAERVRPLSSARGASASPGAQRLSDADLFAKYEQLGRLASD